jgi:hypothetical protein
MQVPAPTNIIPVAHAQLRLHRKVFVFALALSLSLASPSRPPSRSAPPCPSASFHPHFIHLPHCPPLAQPFPVCSSHPPFAPPIYRPVHFGPLASPSSVLPCLARPNPRNSRSPRFCGPGPAQLVRRYAPHSISTIHSLTDHSSLHRSRFSRFVLPGLLPPLLSSNPAPLAPPLSSPRTHAASQACDGSRLPWHTRVQEGVGSK